MTITIDQRTTKEVEIETPAFFRISNYEVVAVFDEQNIVSAYSNEDLVIIKSSSKRYFSDFAKLTDENIIPEKEFFDAFNEVHNSLSFKAQLIEDREIPRIDNGSDQAYETLKQLTSF